MPLKSWGQLVSDKPEDDESEELTVTIVCAGPPYCHLIGDKAVEAQEKGCLWCAKIYSEPDGREIIDQPGTA